MECAWTRYAGSAAEACRLTRRGLDDLAKKWAAGGCGPWAVPSSSKSRPSTQCGQSRPTAVRELNEFIDASHLFLEIAFASWEVEFVAVAESLQDGLDIFDGELQRLY